jgi:hypothetical protein
VTLRFDSVDEPRTRHREERSRRRNLPRAGHREERSDAAISRLLAEVSEFASLRSQ